MRKPVARRGILSLVSLDIKNAFNSISWLDFISTLCKRNVPPYLIRIMKSYLSDRYLVFPDFKIKLNSGGAQGSILGPLIFLIIFDEIVRMKLDICAEKNVYADDTLLAFETENVETLLKDTETTSNKIKKKLKKKKLIVEKSKTEALILAGT